MIFDSATLMVVVIGELIFIIVLVVGLILLHNRTKELDYIKQVARQRGDRIDKAVAANKGLGQRISELEQSTGPSPDKYIGVLTRSKNGKYGYNVLNMSDYDGHNSVVKTTNNRHTSEKSARAEFAEMFPTLKIKENNAD